MSVCSHGILALSIELHKKGLDDDTRKIKVDGKF